MTFLWVVFSISIIIAVVYDLWLFYKKPKDVTHTHDVYMSIFWVVLAFAFAYMLYILNGRTAAIEFISAYLLEKSLSVDNLFVFTLVFRTFAIPQSAMHKILFWGVFGAIVFRALFIISGLALIKYFSWLFPVFGFFLIFFGIRFLLEKNSEKTEFKEGVLVKASKKYFNFDAENSDQFIIRKNNKRYITRLFLALVAIESADVVFALDSIPAVFGITQEPLIVYTSNIFAILGLRSLYFIIDHYIHALRFIQMGLAYILMFIGVKMVLHSYYPIDVLTSLIFICTTLLTTVVLSYIYPEKVEK